MGMAFRKGHSSAEPRGRENASFVKRRSLRLGGGYRGTPVGKDRTRTVRCRPGGEKNSWADLSYPVWIPGKLNLEKAEWWQDSGLGGPATPPPFRS